MRRTRSALAVEAAYAYLAGGDPRPLLVLRECISCTKTDDALMTRQADNEQTMLMSRWFHCIKLPPDVLDEDHPFHSLFSGKDPAHLFVVCPDGSNRINLRGDQSRTELWKAMGTVLERSYEDPPEEPLKKLARILDLYDELDSRIAQLERQGIGIVEKEGPQTSKFKKVSKELTKLRAERDELRSQAIGVSRIGVRPPPEEQGKKPA